MCAFVTCPRQGLEMEAVVQHRVGFLAYFCPKQGQDFKPSAAPLYPNLGQVPSPPPPGVKELLAGYLPDATVNTEKVYVYYLLTAEVTYLVSVVLERSNHGFFASSAFLFASTVYNAIG